ncbi:hypothetical protein BV22DRAFT_1022256 [Leucogyrophana mollusca]|uniref:Uncharacterized protein n=1 Tax=Leucogyrophana mollusca TaxID=85980 RepID=A0ACB8B3B7_9AGAM|nr:hypothetical protein BV22DRAFT_1022256 [Leucogyrophana mollusca]
MFSTVGDGQLPELDGASDDKPIVLEQIKSSVFELFFMYLLWKVCGLGMSFASDNAVIELLQMSDLYMSQRAREFAIQHISNRKFHHNPLQLLSLASRYQVATLFTFAFKQVVPLRFSSIPLEDRRTIDSVVWAALFEVKERLDEHRRIVACEEPPMIHAPGCSNPDQCAADWHQLWWNGMGRFLLDGRNPQPYDDAVTRFEKLEIGEIDDDCWNGMLDIVKRNGAFKHDQNLVEETSNGLAAGLLLEPVYGADEDDIAMA